MKINFNNKSNTFSFKAGLTTEIKKRFSSYDSKFIERDLKKDYNIDANFEYNRAAACCCATVADIFNDLHKKYNIASFDAMPPKIRMYDESQLVSPDMKNAHAFCILDSIPVFKGEPEFELRSIFINNNTYRSLSDADNIAEMNFRYNWNSTNHFLHTIMHEWVHNIHNDFLYKIFGYDGHCPLGIKRYNTLNGQYYDPNPMISGIDQLRRIIRTKYNPSARHIIKNNLSEYAAGTLKTDGEIIGGTPFEFVAENITKKIINVLHPQTLLPTKNPFADNNKDGFTLNDIFYQAWNGILWR